MPFDINDLFSNPAFAFGASLLGNARQPGAINSAFGIANQINKFKSDREAQSVQFELDRRRNESNEEYQKGLIKQAEAKAAYEKDQNARLEKKMEQEYQLKQQQAAMMQGTMRAFAKARGLDPSMFGLPMAEPQPPQAPAGQPGAQQASMEYNIPQGGQLNTPPIGQMPGENPNGITAPIAPTLPVPPGMAAPQEGAPFNPDAMDPAGPFTGKGNGLVHDGYLEIMADVFAGRVGELPNPTAYRTIGNL